jgi:hypothetical protein
MAQLWLAIALLALLVVVQAVVLGLLLVRLGQRFKAEAAASRQRHRTFHDLLTSELTRLETTAKASRAETATFLESIFSGVRGLAHNLDAARATTAQTLEELHRCGAPLSPSAVTAETPPLLAPAAEAPPPATAPAPAPLPFTRVDTSAQPVTDPAGPARTLEEARPLELVRAQQGTPAVQPPGRG